MIAVDSRLLPAAVDEERFVLGAILQSEQHMHAARPVLECDDFSLDKHKRIWKRAAEVYDAGGRVERVSVFTALRDASDNVTLSDLLSLDDGIPSVESIDGWIRTVKDKAILRKMIYALDHLEKRCYAGDKPHEILDAIGKTALDLQAAQETKKGLISAKQLVDTVGVTKLLSPRMERGVMTPWAWMNHWTCGLLPGELWILAGHTSTGKTSAALQLAAHVARNGSNAAIFSLEMSNPSIFMRAVYQRAQVDAERAKRGQLSTEEQALVRDSMNALYELPLYFDDSACSTVMGIHSALRRLRMTGKIGLVVVDYLQLLGDGGKAETRAQAVGANARALKLMANEFECPVLLLSQFSRESAKAKQGETPRKPELYDLKESGDIENHANGVWFIYRPSPLDMDLVPVEFILAKQRDGRRNIAQEFWFRPKCQRFDAKEND